MQALLCLTFASCAQHTSLSLGARFLGCCLLHCPRNTATCRSRYKRGANSREDQGRPMVIHTGPRFSNRLSKSDPGLTSQTLGPHVNSFLFRGPSAVGAAASAWCSRLASAGSLPLALALSWAKPSTKLSGRSNPGRCARSFSWPGIAKSRSVLARRA